MFTFRNVKQEDHEAQQSTFGHTHKMNCVCGCLRDKTPTELAKLFHARMVWKK